MGCALAGSFVLQCRHEEQQNPVTGENMGSLSLLFPYK